MTSKVRMPGTPGTVARLYRLLFTKVLRRVDAETAHHLAARVLKLFGEVPPLRWATSALVGTAGASRAAGTGGTAGTSETPVFAGRVLPGRLGLAAGFDKNATMVRGLAALGFGFIEVGTVTAVEQPGNERPRLWRMPEQGGLVNRMGFNNDGATRVAARLQRLRRTAAGRRVVLGVNIGKSKVTPASQAVADYTYSARLLAPMPTTSWSTCRRRTLRGCATCNRSRRCAPSCNRSSKPPTPRPPVPCRCSSRSHPTWPIGTSRTSRTSARN